MKSRAHFPSPKAARSFSNNEALMMAIYDFHQICQKLIFQYQVPSNLFLFLELLFSYDTKLQLNL